MEGLKGLKGLTSQDRANWEKEYSSQLQGLSPEQAERFYRNTMFKNKFGTRSDYEMLKRYTPEQRDSIYNEELDIKPIMPNQEDSLSDKIGEAFQQGVQYKEQADSLSNAYMSSPGAFRRELDTFDKVATEVSPYYKKYKNTEYLPFSDDEKLKMMAEYNAAKSAFGEETAKANLRRLMQNTASDNQSTWEKYWNGFKGMGAQIAGALISAAGMIKGAIDYIGDDANPELNPVVDFFDHVVDNSWTQYGNDVMQYGSLFDAEQKRAKEQGGISNIPIIRTTAEEEGSILDNLISVNTVPELINQQGFTIASMLTSAGLTSISNKAFQGMKGAALAFNRANSVANLEKMNRVLSGLQSAQQKFNAFAVPALTGTVEGVTEGLNTKIQFLDDAKYQISQAQTKAVNDRFQQMLANPEELSRLGYDPQDQKSLEKLYNDIYDSYAPQYEEAVNRAEVNASKAGVYNMALNSMINGAANMTLKAGMQTPEVQEALRRSRLGRLFTSGDYRIDQSGTVRPSVSKLKRVLNVLQEPAGEFAEEYLQSVSDAFARGGAEYNLANFLTNKYLGNGKDAVDDSMANDFLAASRAAGESMLDKQTILSGIYGALSSGMGTPTINTRRGPAIRMQDESTLEYGLRRSPITYRNPIFEAIREQRMQDKEMVSTAATINNWLQDPENKGRYDGLVGTFNWARQMDEAAGRNDEFEYRNSTLGKTINDAIMLSHLQGTQYYNSFMTDATRVANMEQDSPEAELLVQQFKAAPNNRDIQQSDEQIFETIKKNANRLLNTISIINDEAGKLDKMLGNAVDNDTKQALIFGKMSIDNWRDRASKLEEEIGQTQIQSSIQSNIPENLRSMFVKYGTIAKASEASGDISDQIEQLEDDITNINKRKNILGDTEKQALKVKKAKLATLKKQRKELYNQLDNAEEIEDVSAVLSEQDIMQLNPEDRAIILNPENKSKYSQEQQQVIDNIMTQGTSMFEDFSNKIQDAGRINIAQRAYLTQYNSILSDPESFNTFTQRVKQKVADDNARAKYNYLGGIDDYSTFVKELDKAYDGASIRERSVVRDLLKDNQNYNRYIEDNKVLEGMFDQLEHNSKFTGLTDIQQTMVLTSMQYLTDRGIRPDNSEEAVNALLESDEDGNSNLLTYLDNVNSKLPEGMRAIPSSIEEVIKIYKDVIDSYHSNRKEVENVSQPVVPQSTTPEQSAPSNPFAGIASSTLEGANQSLADVEKREAKGEEKSKPGVFGEIDNDPNKAREVEVTSAVDRFKLNSNDEVANAAQAGMEVITSASSVYDKDIKRSVRQILDDLADSEYADKEALSQAIMTAANQMEVQIQQGGDNAERTSSLLKQVAVKVAAYKPSISPATQPSPITNNTRRNNSMIGTAEVWRHENTIVGKAYKDFRIDEYLKSGKFDRKKPVMFVATSSLINGVKQEMGDSYNENDHLPILAVVEDEKGPLVIDGKNYQPIGFMPRTSADTSGAARMEPIRQLAISQQDSIVKDSQGVVITTNGYVRANPPRHLDASEPNNSLLQILNNDMDANERDVMNDPNVSMPDRSSIYRKYKNKMLSKIRKVGEGKTTHLSYMLPNMKNDSETEFQLFVTTPEKSKSRSGVPIAEVLKSGDAKAILSANSRFARYGKSIQDFFRKNPIQNVKLMDDNGTIVPSGPESEAKLAEIAKTLGDNLENFLYLPSGYNYTLTPTDQEAQTGRVYMLNLTNGEVTIPLAPVYNGEISADNIASAITNLLLDEGGMFRMNGSQPLVKYQVNYADFNERENETEVARKNRLNNINDIFDDNILEASKESFNYTIRGVDINSPFKQDGTRATSTSTTVANPNNATSPTSINEPAVVATDQVRSGKAIVDSETGAPLEGTPTKVESQIDNVTKVIIDKITADSQAVRLSADGETYVDNNGRQYARVTSIIQADEESGERFDPSSPWITPSTNIGTSIDEFVRDFFADTLKDSYPNVSTDSRVEFAMQLQSLRNYMEAKGLTIIPRDVTVTGTIMVTDKDGKQHSIDVAGTLDLLAYDGSGNFYIFDMKTHRALTISEEKSKKWSRQLSLYQKFLEDKYGIKVASLNIIPIKVSYPAPSMNVQYSVGEGTQLLVNDKEFMESSPVLGEVGSIQFTDVNIQYDKLSDTEKKMIGELLPEGSTPERVVVPESNEPQVDKHTGLTMGKVRNRFGKQGKRTAPISPIGTRFENLSEEIRNAIEARGITKEEFDKLTEQEKQQLIDCAK